jgi:glycosyltransferase involved in cell wall biosynthesis
MHILFLTDNFLPEVNAPASRTFEHCREWVRAGHRVTVITGAPNFPRGELIGGYKNRPFQREVMAGIDVIRVWTYITANEGFARRIVDYASFMASASLASFAVRDVDVVVGTSPQLFTAVAALFAGTLKRVPWVFELRDLWPESIRSVGAMKNTILLDGLEQLELSLYRRAARVVSVTAGMRDDLIRRGIDPDKIDVVTNGVDLSRFSPREKDGEILRRHDLEGRFVVGYIGTHGMAHALETILEAAALLRERGLEDRLGFLFVGDGAAKQGLKERAAALGLRNARFVDSVSKDEVVRYWSVLDAAVIHLKKTPLFDGAIPSKLFECMGMGLPILLGVTGESARLLEADDAGLTFEPENAAALADHIARMLDDPALCVRLRTNAAAAAPGYDRAALARRMLETVGALARAR